MPTQKADFQEAKSKAGNTGVIQVKIRSGSDPQQYQCGEGMTGLRPSQMVKSP